MIYIEVSTNRVLDDDDDLLLSNNHDHDPAMHPWRDLVWRVGCDWHVPRVSPNGAAQQNATWLSPFARKQTWLTTPAKPRLSWPWQTERLSNCLGEVWHGRNRGICKLHVMSM